MYLNDLNDAQKALVLDLLIHGSHIGGDDDGTLHSRIAAYCAEMGIPARFSAKLPDVVALKQLTEISNTVTLRKVLVELVMLAMSDSEYNELERAFTQNYASLTGLGQDDLDRILFLLDEIMKAKQNLDELVNEPI